MCHIGTAQRELTQLKPVLGCNLVLVKVSEDTPDNLLFGGSICDILNHSEEVGYQKLWALQEILSIT